MSGRAGVRCALFAVAACAAMVLAGCARERVLARIPKGYEVRGSMSWSPDGTKLAFSLLRAGPGVDSHGPGMAYVLDVNAHRPATPIGKDQSYFVATRFMPGGQGLMMMPYAPLPARIVVHDLASGKVRVLYQARPDRWPVEARLSADLKGLVVLTAPGHSSASPDYWVRVVDTSSGKAWDLWGGKKRMATCASFSPDSRSLLWQGVDFAQDAQGRPAERYYISHPPFRKTQRAAAGKLDGLGVSTRCWAPDSRRVVAWEQGDHLKIQVVDIHSGASTTIVNQDGWSLQYGAGCTWSPDGRWIAYGAFNLHPAVKGQEDERIGLVSPDGKRKVDLARATGRETTFGTMVWTPDGRAVTVAYNGRIVELRAP